MNLHLQRGARIEGLAVQLEGNPLGPSPAAWRAELDGALESGPDDELLVAWSGTPGDDLFAADPRAWMRPARETLRAVCDAVAPRLEACGRRLCFRPHCRHVLSDPQSCLTFLGEHGEGVFDVALAPAAFLEPSMLDDAAEHLRRAFEGLAATAPVVFLHDVTPDESGGLAAVPLGRGVLPRDATVELLARHVPARTPVVLLAGDLDRQRAWLGL